MQIIFFLLRDFFSTKKQNFKSIAYGKSKVKLSTSPFEDFFSGTPKPRSCYSVRHYLAARASDKIRLRSNGDVQQTPIDSIGGAYSKSTISSSNLKRQNVKT